ncbi:hypothetical protein T484DRAFT_1778459 [Baffinella frigidus]|nr:hypothetical protein T484DRAFT_1778459 [Cryptophyta sp. CCMP2293]
MVEKIKDVPGMLSAVKQVGFDVLVHMPLVGFDVLVHMPFMYFPTFYAIKEFVHGHSWNPTDWELVHGSFWNIDLVIDGCTKYYHNFSKDFTAMFQLWAPADAVLFSLPMWLRMPCRHVVSFGWTAYLSFLRGGIQAEHPKTD